MYQTFNYYFCLRTTTVLQPFFRNHPDEPVPEENFWTLWCKGRLTEADTNQPAGRHCIRTKQCPPPPSLHFCTGRMPFLPPNKQCQSTERLRSFANITTKRKINV